MHAIAVFALTGLLSFTLVPVEPEVATYHDDALHFTLTYPATLTPSNAVTQVVEQSKKEMKTDAEKKALGCISTPLMALRETNDFALIMVMRMDLACLNVPPATGILSTLAQTSLRQGLARLGLSTVSAPTSYKLDNHDAVFLRGAVTDEDGKETAHGAAVCSLVEKSAVCWEVVAIDKGNVTSLLASPVGFDGHPPQPLVPADVIGN